MGFDLISTVMSGRCNRWIPALWVVTSLVTGCALRPSQVPDAEHLVMVKSVRLPDRHWLPWYTRWAEHVWVDWKCEGIWHRIEWDDIDYIRTYELDELAAFADERWERGVAVHRTFDGPKAQRIVAKILVTAKRYPCVQGYRAWPGPNSNSFIDWLARELDMPLVLPPNAIGKDFVTWVHAGVTTSDTGLEFESLPLGIEVGLREGVEVHVLGIAFGVGLWPPSLKLPFLPAIPGGWLEVPWP